MTMRKSGFNQYFDSTEKSELTGTALGVTDVHEGLDKGAVPEFEFLSATGFW